MCTSSVKMAERRLHMISNVICMQYMHACKHDRGMREAEDG